MVAPVEAPMCERCMHRPMQREAVMPPNARTVYWQGCLCDTPQDVRMHWRSLGYTELPRPRRVALEAQDKIEALRDKFASMTPSEIAIADVIEAQQQKDNDERDAGDAPPDS